MQGIDPLAGIDPVGIADKYGTGFAVIVMALTALIIILPPILNRERKKPDDPMAEIKNSLVSMAKEIDGAKRDAFDGFKEARKEMADHDKRIAYLERVEEARRAAYAAKFESPSR